jgi:hypothetical protein
VRKILIASVICFLGAVSAQSKGEGVGLWMEGTISDLHVTGDQMKFVLTGSFRFDQYRGTTRSVVEVDGRRGIPVTIRQGKPFFAMTTDWRGGAIRENGALLTILQTAARSHRVVKLELTEARLAFGPDRTFIVTDGAVIRATDHDLR